MPKQCPDCSEDIKCYAHGGEVENEKLHPEHEAAPMEMVDEGMDSEKASHMEEDLPKVSEALSLAAEVMKDRRRTRMAMGGSVESYEDGSESEGSKMEANTFKHGMDETNDSDELDPPKEDGRDSRGLNISAVHTMKDESHDQSDASLVAQILSDRKKRRRE